MISETPHQPHSDRMIQFIPAVLTILILGLSVLIGTAVLAPQFFGVNSGVQKALVLFVEPYRELLADNQRGNGAIEYVVYVSGDEKQVASRLNAEPGIRYLREGALTGTVVISLKSPVKDSLARLRKLPFAGFAFRSNGFYFCH